MEEFSIEMRDIVEKMKDKVSKTFPGDNILLTANMAKTTHDRRPTIQAVFLLAFRCVAHYKFLLKINTSSDVKKDGSIKLNNIDGTDPRK
jgi:hypothetical protein